VPDVPDAPDAPLDVAPIGGPPGCPDVPPAQGQACTGDVYYCQYYDSPEATCSLPAKCTYSGGQHAFVVVDGCVPYAPASACGEGLPCGVVEPQGRCVVKCTRGCSCDVTTQTLRCAEIKC
jgi:hypothetical protein